MDAPLDYYNISYTRTDEKGTGWYGFLSDSSYFIIGDTIEIKDCYNAGSVEVIVPGSILKVKQKRILLLVVKVGILDYVYYWEGSLKLSL